MQGGESAFLALRLPPPPTTQRHLWLPSSNQGSAKGALIMPLLQQCPRGGGGISSSDLQLCPRKSMW